MIQKVTHRDRFSIVRKIRKDVGKRFAVAQFSVVHQKHDGHSSKLFGKGSQTEIGARIDAGFQAQLTYAVAALEYDLAILALQHREPRRVRRGGSRKKLI